MRADWGLWSLLGSWAACVSFVCFCGVCLGLSFGACLFRRSLIWDYSDVWGFRRLGDPGVFSRGLCGVSACLFLSCVRRCGLSRWVAWLGALGLSVLRAVDVDCALLLFSARGVPVQSEGLLALDFSLRFGGIAWGLFFAGCTG